MFFGLCYFSIAGRNNAEGQEKAKYMDHEQMVKNLIEAFENNSPDVNADIAKATARDSELWNSSADAIVEACFKIEFRKTGAAAFLAMILQEKKQA